MVYTPTDEEKKLIKITLNEKRDWEKGEAWVTDKVSFQMFNVVKKARKNYFGIFNEQYSPVTGRDKIFIPLTEWIIEDVLANIDIDTKDINVKAKNPGAHEIASVFRYVLRKKLDDINFGQILNDLLRRIALDGTGFLKVYSLKGKLNIDIVDRSNMFYDPACQTLDDSSAVMQRHVLVKSEFDKLNLENMDAAKGVKSLDRTGFGDVNIANTLTEIPYVELWERYGWLPKDIFPGNEDDKDSFVYAHSIISMLTTGQPVVHKLEEVKSEKHPYQEFQFIKVPGRLDGRGIAEKLFNVQAYLNEVVNTRLDASRVAQLKLWKIKGNVTPQQFKRLFATSAIKLDAASDIEPMQTGSIDPSSYEDEAKANEWALKVTQSQQATPPKGKQNATNALVQQQMQTKAYNLRMQDILLNLEKVFKEKIVPLICKEMKQDEIIRITGDSKDLAVMDKTLCTHWLNQELSKIEEEAGSLPISQQQYDAALEEMVKSVHDKFKSERYLEVWDELFDTKYDIKVVISDETLNKATMSQQLTNIIQILAGAGMPIRNALKELFDTLGMDGSYLIEDMPQQTQQGQPQGQPQGQGQMGAEQQAGGQPQMPMPANQMNAQA